MGKPLKTATDRTMPLILLPLLLILLSQPQKKTTKVASDT